MNDSHDRHAPTNDSQNGHQSGSQTNGAQTNGAQASSEANSPDSLEAKAQVDQLIDHVNQQIELLAFESPDPFLLRQMVQSLVDPRRQARIALVESFSQIGEPATPFLLEGIASHPEPVVRRACCNALTNIGDPTSVEGLVEALLQDPDIGVKSAAAGALAKVGAPAFDSLRAVLASDQASESCKGHAAWAIASMSSEVSEQLYRNISNPSPAVRTAVIGAIAQLAQKQLAQKQLAQKQAGEEPPAQRQADHQLQSDRSQERSQGRSRGRSQGRQAGQPQIDQPQIDQPQMGQPQMGQPQMGQPQTGYHQPESPQKALTMLTEALNDHSPEVRIEAAANLARLNHQKAYQPLIACLKDRQAEVRKAAALALARLGNPDAIEAITALHRDVETSVQRVAALAIEQLKAQKQKQA